MKNQNDIEPFKKLNIQRNKYQHIIPKSLGAIIRGFKIGATKWFRQNTSTKTVWQRNYYEHIIRYKEEYFTIRNYIRTNPKNWKDDRYF